MRNTRRGFSLIELVIVMAIILILSIMVVGPVQQQLMMAHETAAVSQIRAIHTAEAQYYSQFGRFAPGLADLAGLIPENLIRGKKSGFLFTAKQTDEGYAVTAVPEKMGRTGRRSFYSDQTLVIRDSWTAEMANAGSAAIE